MSIFHRTGHIELSRLLDFIWSDGLIATKPMKQSTGTLIPQTFIDSSLRHLLTRIRSPVSVTWRQLQRTMVYKIKKEIHCLKIVQDMYVSYGSWERRFLEFTFKFGQLSAIANRDTSVTKVPPIFRFCKELALEIWEHNQTQF